MQVPPLALLFVPSGQVVWTHFTPVRLAFVSTAPWSCACVRFAELRFAPAR
jgi:hypothetical protein